MATKIPMYKTSRSDMSHKKEWMAKAYESESARNLESLMKDRVPSVETIKEEMYERVYEALGHEVEGSDLVRVLVIRNETASVRTNIVLSILTLGLWYCLRPRDDDTVLVLTTQGRVLQLRVERPGCCPSAPAEILLLMARYLAIIMGIVMLPILFQTIITGRTILEELHELHLDADGLHDFPEYARQHRSTFVGIFILAFFVICSLLPHDFRDRYRRRHMSREVAAGQFVISGCTCRRRSSTKLFFGKYPPQTVLNLAGNLGNAPICSTVRPSDLIELGHASAPKIILAMTAFLTCLTGIDSFFAWTERGLAVKHSATRQLFCHETTKEALCTTSKCEEYAIGNHLDVSGKFCDYVQWEASANACLRAGSQAPCCAGCEHGVVDSYMSEDKLAMFKSMVSLVADTGTIIFALLAARFAIGLIFATDHIDVLIKRRSGSGNQMQISKFDNTLPISTDFMQHVFALARNKSEHADAKLNVNKARQPQSKKQQPPISEGISQGTVSFHEDDASKWCGVQNYTVDSITRDWEEFFEKEMLVPPDCRWTANVTVPRHCLGLADDEKVLGAWAEMPLHPFNMTFADFLMGGLLYTLLPFGKTRHSVIITNRRLFYVRYRRPAIPLKVLGVDLRIDCFRHDHDVFFGQMSRTNPNFLHKLIHQKFLQESWLPGVVALQNKFGALQLTRSHGDVRDVYQLICSLSRNVSTFLNKEMLEEGGFRFSQSVADLKDAVVQTSSSLWSVQPQLDDAVEPGMDIQVGSKDEQLIFHMTFKDLGKYSSKCYTNTDMVVSTGRLFFWHRHVYKKFDMQAALYWCCCWMSFLNPIFHPRNLTNSCSFVTLPALLSFSTDIAVEAPSWLEPHHQPLKIPIWERLCWVLTHLFDRRIFEGKGLNLWSCCPKRTSPRAALTMMWRLKQSAHADDDFVINYKMKPFTVEEATGSDAEDVYLGLGFTPEQIEDERKHTLLNDQDEKIDELRILMSIVQDQCNKILDEVEVLY